MNNLYIIPKSDIFSLLDDLSRFIEKIEIFKSFQPDYNYEINIDKSDIPEYKWEIKVKVWNDEQKNNKICNKTFEALTVL